MQSVNAQRSLLCRNKIHHAWIIKKVCNEASITIFLKDVFAQKQSWKLWSTSRFKEERNKVKNKRFTSSFFILNCMLKPLNIYFIFWLKNRINIHLKQRRNKFTNFLIKNQYVSMSNIFNSVANAFVLQFR